MADLAGERAPLPLSEAGELAAEVQQQPEILVGGLQPVELGFDHGREVVDAERTDGPHADHPGGKVGYGLDHRSEGRRALDVPLSCPVPVL